VVEDLEAPEVTAGWDDVTVVRLDGEQEVDDLVTDDSLVSVAGSLGAQLLLWEVATAVAGRLLGINPFDQPDVESAKQASRRLLDSPPSGSDPVFTDGPVSVFTPSGADWLGDARSVRDAVCRLLTRVEPERGYLAVMAYLDRWTHADLESVRERLARTVDRPVTFGWGPRFLHSTGQLHKGGPPVGAFLQVTATPGADLPIPGREFGFATLIAAQAAGDATVLAEHGRPVLRLHLDDAFSGVQLLRDVLGH
jgi:glucose-6-phosphate isomerase